MRVGVQKTLKMYVGGAFIRSESGRVTSIKAHDGGTMNAAVASRKDLRNTLEKARAAQGSWWRRTAYNRGQILYRLGEMIDGRGDALPTKTADWQAAADRAVHHAGWSDKVTAVLSTLNPTASAYVNYTMVQPVGVVLSIPHPKSGLLGLVEAAAAPILMGNSVIVLADLSTAELATAFSEALATSDVPAGVVNVLTGDFDASLAVADILDDLDTIWVADGAVSDATLERTRREAATVMRRVVVHHCGKRPAHPDDLALLSEFKTVWMSAMGSIGPAGKAY